MIGVYYSALEVSTCEKEIVFHLEFEEGDPSRYYSMIGCEFSGTMADLREKENDHPDLVSQTRNGHPFCQRLGEKAKQKKLMHFILRQHARREAPVSQYLLKLHFRIRASRAALRLRSLLMVLDLIKYSCVGKSKY